MIQKETVPEGRGDGETAQSPCGIARTGFEGRQFGKLRGLVVKGWPCAQPWAILQK